MLVQKSFETFNLIWLMLFEVRKHTFCLLWVWNIKIVDWLTDYDVMFCSIYR